MAPIALTITVCVHTHAHDTRAHNPRARRTHTAPWRAHTLPGTHAHTPVAMNMSRQWV